MSWLAKDLHPRNHKPVLFDVIETGDKRPETTTS